MKLVHRLRRRNDQAVLLLLVLADLAWAGIAYGSAFSLRVYLPFPLTADLLPVSRFTEVTHPFLFLLGTQVALLYFFGFYDRPVLSPRARLTTRVATALGVQLLATASWYFFVATCPSRAPSWLSFGYLIPWALLGCGSGCSSVWGNPVRCVSC